MIEEVAITETEKGRAVPQTTPPEKPATIAEQTLLFLVMAGVIILDHLSKLYIEIWLPLNTRYSPWPEYEHLFQFTHVSNTGAAFGLFPTGSNIFMVVAFVVAGIIILYNYRLPKGHLLFRVALGLQLGGALGNLIDRLRLGHVTDFMDVGPWPVFNVADASIVAGVLVLVFLMLTESRQQGNEEPSLERPLQRPSMVAERQLIVEVEDETAVETTDTTSDLDQPDMLWNE